MQTGEQMAGPTTEMVAQPVAERDIPLLRPPSTKAEVELEPLPLHGWNLRGSPGFPL